MSRRARTLLVSVVCFVIAFGSVLLVGKWLGGGDTRVARGNERALSVVDAQALAEGETSAVRGFVFYDPQTGALFCSARSSVEGRPACDGTALVLEHLDTNRLDLVTAEEEDGGYDWWSRDAVVLQVAKEHGALRFVDVLR